MKILSRLEKSKDFWFLFIMVFIFFLLRFPSLFEPYWYGDEGIYQTMATMINQGSLLYRDTWDNKPPLLYFLYALFQGDQFTMRLLSLIFGLISIIVFFFLTKKVLFLNIKQSPPKLPLYGATALFGILFGLPLFEGNIANAENFILLPILTSGLLIIRFLQKPRARTLFYVGFLLSVTFLCKIVAIFDLAAFLLFLFMITFTTRKHIIKEIRIFLPCLYGFLIPLGIMTLFFAIQGEFMTFLINAFGQNIDYVAYKNTFIIPQGLLIIKSILLIITISLLFYKRKKFLTGSLFIYLWLVFSLFNASFSGRPYTHYILVLVPSFCLFTSLLFQDFQTHRKQHRETMSGTTFLHIVISVLIIFYVFHNFDIYKKNLAYYHNFVMYLSAQKSLTAYQEFFDPNTPRDYAVAQFLKMYTKKNDTVFLWGNSAQVYKMSETLPPGRYTVAFHIENSKEKMTETAKQLAVKKPRFIIVYTPKQYPFNLSSYRYVYGIPGTIIYESIF